MKRILILLPVLILVLVLGLGGCSDGKKEAYQSGYDIGYQSGYLKGNEAGYQKGFEAGYGKLRSEEEVTVGFAKKLRAFTNRNRGTIKKCGNS